MADDPHSLLTVRQNALRTQLDALTASGPDDPHWPELADDLHKGVIAVLEARRDDEAAALRLLHRVLGGVAVVAAVAVLVLFFSPWNVLPAGLALAVGGVLVASPAVRGVWEPRARTWAGAAAVLGALLTPLAGGWPALVVAAGIGWWAWRCAR
ncbi:hypothetical protein GCM10011609_10620 [Lentzea pudingi]|uniref:Uncharacterized protein n=1 Tax=Lentzea pudingi TaxID=1789439 RepID=A0ABQ2HD01_9PSEU|nr:hypothetical protein [Lentzea pudingi]GGM76604.1 hypothetical protein GCM10011609_10620 [Lentzea pudingi]